MSDQPIPAEAIDGAYETDLAWIKQPVKERGWRGSWGAVPRDQLLRLLEGAAPALRSQGAAAAQAEIDRLTTAGKDLGKVIDGLAARLIAAGLMDELETRGLPRAPKAEQCLNVPHEPHTLSSGQQCGGVEATDD